MEGNFDGHEAGGHAEENGSVATVVDAREKDVRVGMDQSEAELEQAVARAGRFYNYSVQDSLDANNHFPHPIQGTLDAANKKLAVWRHRQLRSMWEFADTAYFFRCFKTDETLASLPKITPSELEETLLNTSGTGLAIKLHVELMRLAYGIRKVADNELVWFKLLHKKMREFPNGFLPKDVEACFIHEEDDAALAPSTLAHYGMLPIRIKVLVLHALVHQVMDARGELIEFVNTEPDEWKLEPILSEVLDGAHHDFYYFVDIEAGCLLAKHWLTPAAGEDIAASCGHGGTDLTEEDKTQAAWAAAARKKADDEDAAVAAAALAEKEADEARRLAALEAEAVRVAAGLGGRVRKQVQRYVPPPQPKPKRKEKQLVKKQTAQKRPKRKSKSNQSGANDGPAKSMPTMESRWETLALGYEELEAMLFDPTLHAQIALLIKEAWLPDLQQKQKQRGRAARRQMNATKQLGGMAGWGDGDLGDPLGVAGEDTAGLTVSLCQ
jgi:pyruvate/2-oxoglutarate dehydrogenase complex dihydrolipoamide acyltransferase (E2) component